MATHDGTHPQLSLEVRQHPALRERTEADAFIAMEGSLKIKGRFAVGQDLHHGDQVTVTVHSADGEVITQGVAEIGLPGFEPITVQGTLVGLERVHTAAR